MTEREWLASDDPARMLKWLSGVVKVQAQGSQMTALESTCPVKVSDRKLRLFACACLRLTPKTQASLIDQMEEVGCSAIGGTTSDRDWAMSFALERDDIPSLEGHKALPRPIRAALLREIVGNPWVVIERERDGKERGLTMWSRKRNPGPGDRLLTIKDSWLTPQVLSLATAAYEDRPGRVCERCKGKGWVESHHANFWQDSTCEPCHGTGRVHDGTLDPARLMVLADALEEAGCENEHCKECKGSGTYSVQVRNAALSAINGYGAATTYSEWRGCRHCGGDRDRKGSGVIPHPLLVHLRSPGPHVRGCWVLDLILGKS